MSRLSSIESMERLNDLRLNFKSTARTAFQVIGLHLSYIFICFHQRNPVSPVKLKRNREYARKEKRIESLDGEPGRESTCSVPVRFRSFRFALFNATFIVCEN